MNYVYVLKMENKGLYIGSTIDLRKRLLQHKNAGKKFVLVYYEAYLSEQDARRREKMLKKFGSSYGHLKKRINNSLKNYEIQ